MIFRAVMLALGQMGDARFRRVFLLGLGLTVALLIGAYLLAFWGVGWLVGDAMTLPLVGTITWIDELASWGSVLLLIVLSPFLMIPVASAITGLFLETVAEAVEARHYPHLPKVGGSSLMDGLVDSLGHIGVLIVANLLALVLYLVLPPLALFIFWGLNGFLLGREYFTVAAMRRVGRAEAKRLRRRHLGTIWAAGVLMAIPLTVPILNLVVPILGAATFTHIYHRLSPSG